MRNSEFGMRNENQGPGSASGSDSAFRIPHPALSRWRLTREGRGWVAICGVMLVVGLVKTINLLILVGYLMVALLGLNAWLGWRAAKRVTVKRTAARPTFAGKPADRTFVLANTAARAASVAVLETSAAHTADVFVPALQPGEERWAVAPLPPLARGVYPTSPAWVVAAYPFGLVSHTVAAEPAGELVILPAVGRVDVGELRRWLVRTGAGDSHLRRPVRRQSNHQADVRGVRAYRPGDSPRDIHWKTTARMNELMVREYDSTEPLDLLLVIDPWLPRLPAAAHPRRLETAVSLAASVLWAWCHGEETPEAVLVVPGRPDGVRAGRATPGFGRDALSLLADVPGSPDVGGLPAAVLRRRGNRCARILVSSRPASPLSDELRRTAGVPFARVDATRLPAWYTPPPKG